jgi:GNAT superfamily N-acetyltransferase
VKIDGLTGIGDAEIDPVTPEDCAELYVLQRCCWVEEALLNDTLAIPALHESLEDVRDWTKTWSAWRVRQGPRLIGAVRARPDGDAWEVGRLMVAPDLAGRGLGRWLLAFVEAQAPADTRRFVLFTGRNSARNIAMYERAGYRITEHAEVGKGDLQAAVFLAKELAVRGG